MTFDLDRLRATSPDDATNAARKLTIDRAVDALDAAARESMLSDLAESILGDLGVGLYVLEDIAADGFEHVATFARQRVVRDALAQLMTGPEGVALCVAVAERFIPLVGLTWSRKTPSHDVDERLGVCDWSGLAKEWSGVASRAVTHAVAGIASDLAANSRRRSHLQGLTGEAAVRELAASMPWGRRWRSVELAARELRSAESTADEIDRADGDQESSAADDHVLMACVVSLTIASVGVPLALFAIACAASIAEDAPFHRPDPEPPDRVRRAVTDGGTLTTSDTHEELLEVEWNDGDELDLLIGRCDAHVRLLIGGQGEKRLKLGPAASNDLRLGSGAGFGNHRSATAVHPHVQGTNGGRLRFLEITTADWMKARATLIFEPRDRLLVSAAFVRIGHAHATVDTSATFSGRVHTPIFHGESTFVHGDTTLILRDAQLVVPDGTPDLPRLIVEGRNQMIPSVLFGCSARSVEVHPIGNFGVREDQHVTTIEMHPRAAVRLEASSTVGTIRGADKRVSGVFDKDGEPLSGMPRVVVQGPADAESKPTQARVLEGVSLQLDEGSETAAHLLVTNRMLNVAVDHPSTKRDQIKPTLQLSESAVADGINFRTGRIVDDHKDLSECHRHVQLVLGPRSVVTSARGSVSIAEISDASLRGASEGVEICSVADDIDFEGARVSNAILALDQNFAAAVATKAQRSSEFDLHPLTWSYTSRPFDRTRGSAPNQPLHRRAVHALSSVFAPDRSYDDRFRSALSAAAALTRTTAAEPTTRAGVRYAWLAFRQTTSQWRVERALLLVGRILGFGVRIARPIAVWLILSAATAGLVALLSETPLDVSLDGLFRFMSRTLDTSIEPSALVRGASSESTLAEANLSEAARFAIRAVLALPFGAALLAIARRATWMRD